jgi:hypothetical protein
MDKPGMAEGDFRRHETGIKNDTNSGKKISINN